MLELVSIIVDEYDEAIDFFRDALDFEVAEDSPSETNDGRPKRWVVVRPKDGGCGLLLAKADGAMQAQGIGNQFSSRVGLFLRVADFDTAYARLVSAGAEITSQPRDEPYGRISVFKDIAGNKWDLLGPRPKKG